MYSGKKHSMKHKRVLDNCKINHPSNKGDAIEETTTSGDSGSTDKKQRNDRKTFWRNKMMKTFERLLLQLDELYMDIRTEEQFSSKLFKQSSAYNAYQSICEKLRMELLIAIDKTDLVTNTNPGQNSQREQELLRKCEMLKSQLSSIRWQYHNAMKEFNLHSRS